ncbi:MAG: SDR family oxidoreductase [Proteobacteria bacterium]|nr:SDR family oxidoreductase [Pseudomonadota bacterium]
MGLERKVAIVTGGAGGIGMATIRALAQEGANVVISDVNWEGAKKLEESLVSEGGKALAVQTDIANLSQVKELARKTLSTFGRIDILVNNAGISPKHQGKKRNLWEMGVEEWERVIDVDLNGYFYCCHEIVPHMILNGWGRIVNISSQAARSGGQVAGSHYTAAKAGVIGLTKSLAGELGKYGITVNAVTPGRIDTPIIRDVPPEVNAEFARRTPLGRLGTPEDVAGAILFLISDAAGFITGATIDVNGGLGMY